MTIGVVALWTEHAPRMTTFRIPADGLALGRPMMEPIKDERMSQTHTTLRVVANGLRIEDNSSRNGTFVGGERLGEPRVIQPRTVIRCGRTVFLLVEDIEAYESCKLTTRHGLTVGISLAGPCDELEQAIRDETSIAIIGARGVGRTLARSYLKARNGGAEIDAKAVTEPLERVLCVGTATRTVLLEAPNALTPSDLETLATWLETDVRFVTVVGSVAELVNLPPEIVRWLAPKTIEIPHPRHDELPTALHAAIAKEAPGIALHARFIEAVLRHAHLDEDKLLEFVADAVEMAVARGETKLSEVEFVDLFTGSAHVPFDPRARMIEGFNVGFQPTLLGQFPRRRPGNRS